jgi:peptidoglycan hydrolase-like protein with peptidoglycan-binding domain
MGINESSRSAVIELLTRRDDLRPYEVTLLQAGLKHLGLYKGELDGSFKDGTAKAAHEFLSQNGNRHIVPLVGDQTRNAVLTYSQNLAADAERNLTFGQKYIPTWLGGPEKPNVPNPYAEMFGNNPRPLLNERRGMSLHTVMSQPNALIGEDIEALQRGLKIPGADGYFGRVTSISLARHLTSHPEDFGTIGVPLLNLAMHDADSRTRLQELPKPQEYYDRVSKLIQESGGLRELYGTNALTYELQVLLNAGGYFRTRAGERSFSTPDGGPGEETMRAIQAFEREKPKRRASLDGLEGDTQLADASTGGPQADAVQVAAATTPDVSETVANVAKPAPFKPFA